MEILNWKKRYGIKKACALFFGLVAAIEQLIYWVSAIFVSTGATMYEGKPYWTSGGPGSFFPWPKRPGMLTVMTAMNDKMDRFIYFLIRYYLFPFAALIIVVLFMLIGWVIGCLIERVLKNKELR